jgi:hypothetical protein
MEKQLCSFLKPKLSSKEKTWGLDLWFCPTKMKFLPEGEEAYSKFHQRKLTSSNGN